MDIRLSAVPTLCELNDSLLDQISLHYRLEKLSWLPGSHYNKMTKRLSTKPSLPSRPRLTKLATVRDLSWYVLRSLRSRKEGRWGALISQGRDLAEVTFP